jgi:bla regulator protein BlaR1
MIAAWMMYSTALGILLVLAAFAVERFVRDQGGQTRRVWLVALAGTVVLPALALVMKDATPAVELGNVVVASSATAGAVMEGVATLAPLDTLLSYAWAGGSALLLLMMVIGLASTHWRARGWTRTEIDGVPVLLSQDVGPAVVGLLRNQIVMPAWALALDPAERAMMLRHEQEHVRTGDPRLLLFALCFGAAMPWNAPVWAMIRRVRLALEVDCDRRVVGAGDLDLRRYAELLISVCVRRAVPAYGVGFSVGRPFLEERIDRMTLPPVKRRRVHGALLVCGVAGVVAAAWSIPQPIKAVTVSHTFEMSCPDDTSDTSRELLTAMERAT